MNRRETKQLWLSKYPSTSTKTKEHLKDMFYRRQANNALQLERVPITAPLGAYQADLMFLPNYSGYNRQYDAILNVIDVNTRYLYSYPIRNKNTTAAFTHLLEDAKPQPNMTRLDVDKGSEFLGQIPELLAKHNIELRTHDNKFAMAIVERVNRTIRDLIERAMELRDNYNWLDILPDLIAEYNNSPHSSLVIDGKKVAPAKLTKKQAEFLLSQRRELSAARIGHIQNAFPIGAKVLRKCPKTLFEKGATPNYGDTVYTVKAHQPPISIVITAPGREITARYYDLQVVSPDTKPMPPATASPRPARPKLTKQRQTKLAEKREGIDEANIINSPRQRRPNPRYQTN